MDIIVSRVWGYIFKNIHAILTLIILKFPSLPDDIRMEIGNTVSANCNQNFWLKEFKDKFSLSAYILCILLGCNRKFIRTGNFTLTRKWNFHQEKKVLYLSKF